MGKLLLSPHSQCISDAIDVVEERGNQRDLENPRVIEPNFPKRVHIVTPDGRRVFGDLFNILQHSVIAHIQLCLAPIPLQCLGELCIKADTPQKLCVRFNSIETTYPVH